MKKREPEPPTKREMLHELLGLLGNDVIQRPEFWSRMRVRKLTDDDIDAYLRGELQ